MDDFLKELFGDNVIVVDPGETVLCDMCNDDYTDSEETGGFLFSSNAVCPKCAPNILADAIKYNEQHFITPPKEGESFRDFVYRIRRGE